MRQFNYYGTWNDSLDVVQAILKRGDIRVIHDSGIWHRPVAKYFHVLTEELETLLKTRPFLFLYGKFSRFEPGFVLQENGPNAGTYWVSIKRGGPGLELGLPVCFENNGTICLGSRFLAYPAEYLNPETHLWERQCEEVRSTFSELRLLMKKCCLKRKKMNSPLFIGPRALELLNQGKARIIDRGVSS
jgi:hypothetical protein